jgi:fatty acid desaturase
MSNIEIQQRQFEKASQELFKESWELGMFCIGLVVSLFLVFSGIYYSQLALALLFGIVGITYYFNYAVAILVSALEVAMIKLFGNKERSGLIKSESGIEHKIVSVSTWVLFIFDYITNFTGLLITAKLALKPGENIEFLGYVLILICSGLMAFSEVFAGWMMRGIGTSFISWKYAKSKFDLYQKQLDRNINQPLENRTEQDEKETNSMYNQGKRQLENTRHNINGKPKIPLPQGFRKEYQEK